MAYDDFTLSYIYDKNKGYCNICGKKLAYSNYGTLNTKGAWEVDHSKSKAKGGTNHRNNLFSSCISCNRGKRACSTKSARKKYGRYYEDKSSNNNDDLLFGLGIFLLFLGLAGLAKQNQNKQY